MALPPCTAPRLFYVARCACDMQRMVPHGMNGLARRFAFPGLWAAFVRVLHKCVAAAFRASALAFIAWRAARTTADGGSGVTL